MGLLHNILLFLHAAAYNPELRNLESYNKSGIHFQVTTVEPHLSKMCGTSN